MTSGVDERLRQVWACWPVTLVGAVMRWDADGTQWRILRAGSVMACRSRWNGLQQHLVWYRWFTLTHAIQ